MEKAGTYIRSYPVDASWLRQKYVEEGLDCTKIAKLIGRNPKSVWVRLRKHGIPARPRGSSKGITFTHEWIAAITQAQRLRRQKEGAPTAVCQNCKGSFRRNYQTYDGVSSIQKFCSRRCSARGKRRPDPMIHKMAVFMRNCIHRLGVNTKALERTQRHSEKILGYTRQDLRSHLESQFAEGMNWGNYGGVRHHRNGSWVIDHKIPIVHFVKNGVIDPSVINALSNLQPLWSAANRVKAARMIA